MSDRLRAALEVALSTMDDQQAASAIRALTDPLPLASGPGAILSAEELVEIAEGWPVPRSDAVHALMGDLLIQQLGHALATERAARIAVEAERDNWKAQRDEWRSVFVPKGGAFGPEFAKDMLRLAAEGLDELQVVKARAEQAEASLSAMTAERDALHDRFIAALLRGDNLVVERDALRTALDRFMSATLMPTPTKPIIVARQEAAKVLAAGPQGETSE